MQQASNLTSSLASDSPAPPDDVQRTLEARAELDRAEFLAQMQAITQRAHAKAEATASVGQLAHNLGDRLMSRLGVACQPLSPEEFQAQVAAIDARERARVAQEAMMARQRSMDALFNRAAVPRRYRAIELHADPPPQPDPLGRRQQLAAYAAAREFAAGFDQDALRTGRGLLLWSRLESVGTGKTALACAVLSHLARQGRSVMYCTVAEAVASVSASWRKGSDRSEVEVFRQFATAELLVLDEVGVQLGTEFEKVTVSNIADARSRECLPTIVCTNLTPREMLGLLGERALDRLTGFGAVMLEMSGESLR